MTKYITSTIFSFGGTKFIISRNIWPMLWVYSKERSFGLYLLQHGALVYMASSKGPPRSAAFISKKGVLKTFSNWDPHRINFYLVKTLPVLNKYSLFTLETFPINKQAGAKVMTMQAAWLKVAITPPLPKRDVTFHLRPSIEQTWIPFIQSWILPTLVEIGLVLLEKKMNIWKVYRSQTNDGQQAIRKAHLSTQLRWAKIL